MHAVDPVQVRANKTDMTVAEMIAAIEDLPGNAEWIILSGGNPALHDLTYLIEKLHNRGYKVSVETQGSRWRDWLRDCDIVCISPKGPSAGMMDKFTWDGLDLIVQNLQVGYVKYFLKVPLFNEEDMEFLWHLVRRYPDSEVMASIGNWWAPGSETGETLRSKHALKEAEGLSPLVLKQTKWVVEKMLEDQVLGRVRVIPQLHTLLWGNDLGR